MNYKIEIRDIESVRAAFIKYKGIVSNANKVFPEVFKAIGGKANGAPFFCYYLLDKETKSGEMDLCVPTDAEPSRDGVTVREMPGIHALCTTHVGSYESINCAYDALEKYAEENGMKLDVPFREIYIKGPGMIFKGNPEKYITEIQIPLKEGI